MLPEFLKVAKKAVIILVLFIGIDLLFGVLYKPFYTNQGPSRFNKMIYGDNGGNKEDIIILGDSRAEHHYNSSMIAERFGKSVYNYGSDGQSVFYNYAVLRKLLDTYVPEKVIYEISLDEIVYKEDAYDRLSYFLPLHNKYADQIQAEHLNPFKVFISKLFYSYKYNSTLFVILKSYVSPKKYDAGYQPLNETIEESLFDEDPTEILYRNNNYPVDSLKVHYFEEIIKLSKEYNFDIEFFVSPMLFHFENDVLFSTINSSLSKFNHSANVFINDSAYKASSFADPTHLNYKAANHYTDQVLHILK